MADWKKHWYGNFRGGKAERKRTGLVENEKLPSREVEKEAGDHRIVVTCRVSSWAAVWRQYFNNESRDVRSRGSVGMCWFRPTSLKSLAELHNEIQVFATRPAAMKEGTSQSQSECQRGDRTGGASERLQGSPRVMRVCTLQR